MPSPKNQAIVDPVTTQVVLGYSTPGHCWDFLFPAVNVPGLSGKIVKFSKKDFGRVNSLHSPGSNVARVRFGHESDSYSLETHSLDGIVYQQTEVATDHMPNRVDRARTAQSTLDVMGRNHEIDAAETARDPSNYDAGSSDVLSGTDQWSDFDNSDPITDIKERMEVVRSKIGEKPNRGLIPEKVWLKVSEHPKVVGRISNNSDQIMTPELFARLVGLEEVKIAGSTEFADDEFQDIWGKDVVLARVARNPSNPAGEPSYGYTYRKTGHPLARVPRFEENIRSWLVGVDYYRKALATSMEAGYLIRNAVE